ncbi:unnamed protein product [Timema podura]|uniref:Uncharacterized protein n=1 Tax=Timema podura TaxID=61482 RepID=A0ABN7NN60_TIMPD|nr:unnamed protein product [Timema podura]
MLSWIVAILFLSLPLTSQFQKRKEDLQDKRGVPEFAWRKIVKSFEKNHPQYIRLGSNPNLSVIGSLVNCEIDALGHAATDVGVSHVETPWREKNWDLTDFRLRLDDFQSGIVVLATDVNDKKMYLFQDVSGHNKIPRKASFPSLDDIDNRINENYTVINFQHKEKITEKHQDDSETGFSGDFIGEQKDYRYVINDTAVQSDYLNKPTSLENYFDRSNSLLSYRNTADDYDKIVFPLHYEGLHQKEIMKKVAFLVPALHYKEK